MSYIPALERSQISDSAIAAGLDGVQRQLGVLPNMLRVMANSPVALNAYLQLAGVSASGRLNGKQREQIALAVAETNSCDYCSAAHSVIGAKLGLSAAQIDAARALRAETSRDAALLQLAARIVETRGHVPTAELDAFKAQGLDDSAILEVLVNVVLNIYTNYTNHLARTEIDFPRAQALAA